MMSSNRNTPLHDGQGHWWSGQTNIPSANVQRPTTTTTTTTTTDTTALETVPSETNNNNHQKKGRRRGNRRLQRFRQRLSKRGYDTETIAMLMNTSSEELGIVDPPVIHATKINNISSPVS